MESKQNRAGKSFVHELSKSYCRLLGGKPVADEVKDGLRTETYELPDGRKWVFVSSSSREDAGQKS